MYLHQKSDWPRFSWDDSALLLPLSQVRQLQGKLIGKMEAIGFSLREEALLGTLTTDVIKSEQIEREKNKYYDILELTQKGSLDVTNWLQWFLGCALEAVNNTEETLAKVLAKANLGRDTRLPCSMIVNGI